MPIQGKQKNIRTAGSNKIGRAAHGEPRPNKYVIGIDEVGRGCLAGPLYVVAVCMPVSWSATRFTKAPARRVCDQPAGQAGMRYGKHENAKLPPLRDSKRLSAKQREMWVEYIARDRRIMVSIARVTSRTIDRMNVSQAANKAALAAFYRLVKTYYLSPSTCRIILDGGLFLGNNRRYVRTARGYAQTEIHLKPFGTLSACTVIKGDERYTAVALASIIAKVRRDAAMAHLSRRYPAYGFDVHKGYGTTRHFQALKINGPCKEHRATFLH